MSGKAILVDPLPGIPGVRTLGTGPNQALPGDTAISFPGGQSPITYGVYNGTSGAIWQTTDKAQLRLTTVADMQIRLSHIAAISIGGNGQRLLAKYTQSGNHRAYQFAMAADDGVRNMLTAQFSTNQTNIITLQGADIPLSLMTRKHPFWLRCILQSNNGAGKSSAAFYYSFLVDPSVSSFSDWVQIGNTITNNTPGPFTSASNAPLAVGGNPGDNNGFLTAHVYRARLYGASNTLVADYDMATRSTTSFSDGLGNTWTPGASPVNGSYVNAYARGTIPLDALDTSGLGIGSTLRNWTGGAVEAVPDAWPDVRSYGAIFDGNTRNSAKDTAGLLAALADTHYGTLMLPQGAAYIDKPLVVLQNVQGVGGSHPHGTEISPSANFPTNTLSGTLTLPLSSATVTVSGSMHPNWLTTGGVVNVVSSWGPTCFTYTSISGNTFVGCNGGLGGGTVSNGATLGSPMVMLGDPNDISNIPFSTQLRDVDIHCVTDADNDVATAIPGCTGIWTSRIQQFAGVRNVTIGQAFQNGLFVDKPYPPGGQAAQNFAIQGLRIGAGAGALDNFHGAILYGYASTLSGAVDITVNAGSNTTANSVGVRLIACRGTFNLSDNEHCTVGCLIDDQTALPNAVTIRDINGANVTQVKITAGGTKPIIIEGCERYTTTLGATTPVNLIVDDRSAITLTDTNVGTYRIGSVASGHHYVFSDSPNTGAATPFAPVQVVSH